MSESNLIETEFEDGVFTITLNHPKANAFNEEVIAGAQAAFKSAGRDPNVRCVLLTGKGKVFSAGQDVKEFGQAGEVSIRRHLLRTYNPLILQIRRFERPVLAAINGAVAGAALGVTLACDLRIASEDARFFVGFLGIGLGLDSGVSLLLPSIIGLGRASEYAFTNQPISAGQALAWGLVNRLAPAGDLQEQARAWASELARGPVHAMGLAKRAFNRAVLGNLEDVLDYEAHLQEVAGQGADFKEGLQAFLEKRPANFLREAS